MKKLVKFMGIMAMMLAVSVIACNGGSDDDDDDTPSIDNPDSGSGNGNNTGNGDSVLPSTSTEGRLSLEAVEGGIKVTARLLDTDGTPDSNDSYDNFNIKEKKSGIMVDLQRPLVGENPKEVSGIFPFVKENETYEFEFLLSVPSLSIPYHTELAGCKAASTGLNPDDYFDFDKSPAETKVIITEEGCLSIDKDIVSFFKQQPDYVYLRGTLFAGKNDPWDADWIGNWICNKEGWEIGVDYDELISATGFDLSSEVSPETIDKIISKGSWFTQDVYLYFSVDDIPYRMELIKSDVVSIKTGN